MVMAKIERSLQRFSNWLENFAGTVLVAIMLLSGAEVVGRMFGKPIQGTYEIVSYAGGLVLGFAIPVSVLMKVHIIVDLLVEKISLGPKFVLHVIARLMGAAIFTLMGYALIRMASNFRVKGDFTPVLQLPLYPIVYAMGAAFLLAALILITEATKRGGAPNA
jgi:TRAP-type C4-dicarboxylate transport system permease small subunit